MYNELNEQLELGFDRNVIREAVPRKRRRVARADWWFDQIRKMIDADVEPAVPRHVQRRLEFSPTRTVSFPA
ncbi:MAG: hypothetical protein OSB29_07330 [Verrucomicrobiota bacterium]|nr:hypothetical protein [Verrucomicrobiota bacterium]